MRDGPRRKIFTQKLVLRQYEEVFEGIVDSD